MRWFKHLSGSHQDEEMAEVIFRLGPEGYGVWWIILEAIAMQMDATEKCSARYPAKKWGSFCGFSAKKFEKFAGILAEISSISVEKKDKLLEIECPNLLKYRDEYSKKSGQRKESVRPKIQKQKQKQRQKTEENKPLSGKPDLAFLIVVQEGSPLGLTKQEIDDFQTMAPLVNVSAEVAKIETAMVKKPLKDRDSARRHIAGAIKYLQEKEQLYLDIIKYLNTKIGKKFDHKTGSTRQLINGRLSEGHDFAAFKKVIDTKTEQWKGTDQDKYLRPETLFRPSKFESYLNETGGQGETSDDDDLYREALKRHGVL